MVGIGVVVFDSRTGGAEADALYEFEASLDYRVNSRPARTTPCLKI